MFTVSNAERHMDPATRMDQSVEVDGEMSIPLFRTITCCVKTLHIFTHMLRGKCLQNVVPQNLGLACSLLQPAVVFLIKPRCSLEDARGPTE